ncbi:Polynucleotide 5'-hydroxyl-kinase grc3 [Pleurotus pulmonarius]|nr:Polynucleotide 5'-hydroxyl-kinase grc3 [Pleurotus pulmonarius]
MLSAIAARKAAKSAPVAGGDEAAPRKAVTSDIPSVRHPKSSRSSKRKISNARGAEEFRVGAPKRQKPTSGSNSNPQAAGGKGGKEDVPVIVSRDLRESEGDSDSADSGLSTGDDDAEVPVTSLPPPRGRHWSPSAPVADSGSDEEEPEANLSSLPNRSPTTFQPSDTNTLRLTPDEVSSLGLNAEHGSAVAMSLSVGERFCLLGAYTVVVVHGSLEACGALFTPSTVPRSHRVFAPKCSHLPTFECIPASSTPIPSPSPGPPRLQPICQKFSAVVVIQELSLGVDGLERVFGTFNGMFRESQQEKTNGEVVDIGLRGVQMVTRQTRSLQPLTLLPSWNTALSSSEPPPSSSSSSITGVFLVKGPKKTGKSTFAVTLLNKVLSQYTKVAFLECDIGQSEFGPAGMVSLHVLDKPVLGPAFTHPSLPFRAHFIGSTSPRSSPSHYLASVDSLFQTYRTEVQTPGLEPPAGNKISEYIPLVVNTMGWVKGLGASLLESIEEIVHPTHVFEFESSAPFSSRNPIASPSAIQHRFLEPFVSSLAYTAADQRSLSILSYFHAVFLDRRGIGDTGSDFALTTPDLWDTSLPLCARFPFEVDCRTAFERVVLAGSDSDDVVPEQIHTVLNGALVALVACEEGAPDAHLDLASQTPSNSPFSIPYVQGGPPPPPSASTCLGLALIRAISPDKQKMHILTPLPPSSLARCRVLVKGEVELPIWGMLDFREQEEGVLAGFEKHKMPYLQWGKSEGVGVERRRVRRNLMRRGQM